MLLAVFPFSYLRARVTIKPILTRVSETSRQWMVFGLAYCPKIWRFSHGFNELGPNGEDDNEVL